MNYFANKRVEFESRLEERFLSVGFMLFKFILKFRGIMMFLVDLDYEK